MVLLLCFCTRVSTLNVDSQSCWGSSPMCKFGDFGFKLAKSPPGCGWKRQDKKVIFACSDGGTMKTSANAFHDFSALPED